MSAKPLKRGPAIHAYPRSRLVGGKMIFLDPDRREIEIMATAKGYAMVRRKGALPYVAPIEEIEQQ